METSTSDSSDRSYEDIKAGSTPNTTPSANNSRRNSVASRPGSHGTHASIHRTFSGDCGGAFGGDGGILEKWNTEQQGWCKKIDRTKSRQSASQPSGSSEPDDPIAAEEKREEKDPEQRQWLVQFDGDSDPESPRSMSTARKWICTWVVSLSNICVTCTSSAYTSCYVQLEHDFGISKLLAVAGLSLFVVGLGCGPMLLAPLSEFYGRRIIYLVSFGLFTIFLIPCAVAPNMAVMLVFRFMTGFIGSAFMSVAGGTVGDMFPKNKLGPPMMLFSGAPFVGPVIGPLIGGFINQHTTWRWTFYVLLIWSGLMLVCIVFLVPETFHPLLLKKKAERLRKETGDDRYHAAIEKIQRSILATIAWSTLRPFQLLIFEPMLLLLCLFSAILLGILYLFFNVIPLVFETVHGFSLQFVGLAFLGILVGEIIAASSFPYWDTIRARLITRNNGKEEPEFRLPPAIFGSILVPIGLFWFAWTTYKSIHWIVPIIGSIVFALGMLLCFSGVFTFTVEAYPEYAASGLAANSFVRSSFAAGFPLFSGVMYQTLGIQWATALLAFITVPMAPVMFVFFKWGRKIRENSRYAGAD